MTVKTSLSATPPKQLTYPILKKMKNDFSEFYVLFTAPRTGVVVHKVTGAASHSIGQQRLDWSEEQFEVTKDVITIQNEG